MSERIQPSPPFIIGQIDYFDGIRYELLFIDPDLTILGIGDPRLDGFVDLSEGLQTKISGDSIVLSSDKTHGPTVIHRNNALEQVTILNGEESSEAVLFGTHIDSFFKQRFVVSSTGETKEITVVDDTLTSKHRGQTSRLLVELKKPIFREGTEGLRVAARLL